LWGPIDVDEMQCTVIQHWQCDVGTVSCQIWWGGQGGDRRVRGKGRFDRKEDAARGRLVRRRQCEELGGRDAAEKDVVVVQRVLQARQ
jgi:hypothetical protein